VTASRRQGVLYGLLAKRSDRNVASLVFRVSKLIKTLNLYNGVMQGRDSWFELIEISEMSLFLLFILQPRI
jgi:hypothetical protein